MLSRRKDEKKRTKRERERERERWAKNQEKRAIPVGIEMEKKRCTGGKISENIGWRQEKRSEREDKERNERQKMNRAEKAWIQGEKIKLQPETERNKRGRNKKRKKRKRKRKSGRSAGKSSRRMLRNLPEQIWLMLTLARDAAQAWISINVRCAFDKGRNVSLRGTMGTGEQRGTIFSPVAGSSCVQFSHLHNSRFILRNFVPFPSYDRPFSILSYLLVFFSYSTIREKGTEYKWLGVHPFGVCYLERFAALRIRISEASYRKHYYTHRRTRRLWKLMWSVIPEFS